MTAHREAAANAAAEPALARRAGVLFVNFLLIILAYYQVKSASRSLLLEHWGADALAWVWIVSAVVLTAFIGVYHHVVARFSRVRVVLGSCLLFSALLVVFRVALSVAPRPASFAFYVFVDLFSVVLVEQFWSLANAVTRTAEGRRSYWFVGSGGLLGGVLGGASAALLLQTTPLTTPDLLLTCAALLLVAFALNVKMGRLGLFDEGRAERAPVVTGEGLRALAGSRYLQLIALLLLCAQIAQPVVDFQFMKTVAGSYHDLDQRTTFISSFFSLLGLVSIGVNVLVTPLVHRWLGAIAGLAVQPLMITVVSLAFAAQPTLMLAGALKIGDRGLSYSINRASKELLYIPVDPVHAYRAKAWIDMLGYRVFKVAGSVLILILTQWLPAPVSTAGLGWTTAAVCAIWLIGVGRIARSYHAVVPVTV